MISAVVVDFVSSKSVLVRSSGTFSLTRYFRFFVRFFNQLVSSPDYTHHETIKRRIRLNGVSDRVFTRPHARPYTTVLCGFV